MGMRLNPFMCYHEPMSMGQHIFSLHKFSLSFRRRDTVFHFSCIKMVFHI